VFQINIRTTRSQPAIFLLELLLLLLLVLGVVFIVYVRIHFAAHTSCGERVSE
jgi:hypothetical protein